MIFHCKLNPLLDDELAKHQCVVVIMQKLIIQPKSSHSDMPFESFHILTELQWDTPINRCIPNQIQIHKKSHEECIPLLWPSICMDGLMMIFRKLLHNTVRYK